VSFIQQPTPQVIKKPGGFGAERSITLLLLTRQLNRLLRHAGLDPASSPHLDSVLVDIPDPDPGRNNDIEVFNCWSNNPSPFMSRRMQPTWSCYLTIWFDIRPHGGILFKVGRPVCMKKDYLERP
jgi:hypothetical protein